MLPSNKAPLGLFEGCTFCKNQFLSGAYLCGVYLEVGTYSRAYSIDKKVSLSGSVSFAWADIH